MAGPSREIVIVPSQTITVNGNTGAIVVPTDYSGVILVFTTGTPAGTTETLNMVIQQGFRAPGAADVNAGAPISTVLPTIWDDFISFTQVTTAAAPQVLRYFAGTGTSGANAPTGSITAASPAGALAAGTIRPGPLGMWWRAIWTVSGTTPSYPTTIVTAQFLNQQS